MAGVVPNALRVDDCDGASQTDMEAIGFGSMHQCLGSHQVELLEPLLEKLPGSQSDRRIGALGLRRLRAQKNMAAHRGQSQGVHSRRQIVVDLHHLLISKAVFQCAVQSGVWVFLVSCCRNQLNLLVLYGVGTKVVEIPHLELS